MFLFVKKMFDKYTCRVVRSGGNEKSFGKPINPATSISVKYLNSKSSGSLSFVRSLGSTFSIMSIIDPVPTIALELQALFFYIFSPCAYFPYAFVKQILLELEVLTISKTFRNLLFS